MSKNALSDIGETAMIQRLIKPLRAGRNVLMGPGDDCAITNLTKLLSNSKNRNNVSAGDLLLTTDPVIETVHFTPETPASAIGHKALARVLSDVAAMGGEPLWVLSNIVAPAETPINRITGIYRAMIKLANRYNVSIVGGDLAQGPTLEIHVFCVGWVPRGKAILRSGARPGQKIFVTGSLGGSHIRKHLCFQPRLAEGRWLRTHQWASAMIDVSDGLASDLANLIAQSQTGATIQLDNIPLSSAIPKTMDKSSALHHALSDGEDFELLFTIPARKAEIFQKAWRENFNLQCSCIGSINSKRGQIECIDCEGNRMLLNKKGYEHFL